MKRIKLHRVVIYKDSAWPSYGWSAAEGHGRGDVQVSEDVIERWNKIEAEYAAYQEELKGLYE